MKLKKKHRPMTFHEWMKSAGGQVFAGDTVAEVGEERMREIAADTDEVTVQVFEEASVRYHRYLCAHIAVLLEKR